MYRPRILFLDAYDSFSNNIISLLHQDLNATVHVIKIDDKRFATGNDACFHAFLKAFDAIVAGPGPGDPRNPKDLGLIGKLWNLPADVCLPVLGICLGFQSLALAYGATAARLSEPRHGIVTGVSHRGVSLFQEIGLLRATQYHSLHVRLGHPLEKLSHTDLWIPTLTCPKLLPLAWDLSDARNGPILMGLQHATKPFWGVQYHPESICTNPAGAEVIRNWWTEALAWTIDQAATKQKDNASGFSPEVESRRFSSESELDGESSAASSLADTDFVPSRDTLATASTTPAATRQSSRMGRSSPNQSVTWKSMGIPLSTIDVTSLLQTLQDTHGNAMMLESGTKNGVPVRPETGRYSIIGCLDAAESIRYSTGSHVITSTLSGAEIQTSGSIDDVWSSIEGFMSSKQATGGPADVPFWGGLIGFISYEAGLETIDVLPSANNNRPDVWFVFVERSIVIDHVGNKVYLQTLRQDDTEWMQRTKELINMHAERVDQATADIYDEPKQPDCESPEMTTPDEARYCNKVSTCQDHIRAGSSYELCLTDQSLITYPSTQNPSPFTLYRRLRSLNPAPFGAYLRLQSPNKKDSISIISSSPERFLSWSRTGKCQFRPIKGTVEKKPDMTREKAEALLNCDKEQAENLMIVDLIRHDLHGVVGSGNVQVEKLMVVEEYQTVFQLVSVIEGQLPEQGRKTGLNVLAASLPPGSMTGAPKKRSCELLTEIEEQPRGIYSGVLGYFDVGGGGDFSVVIRTAFRWDEEECWRIGAGGAVTVLSSPEAEFLEMTAKRSSSVRAFQT